MAIYDLYGLGNALVDTEYHVTDSILASLGIEKGMMTLIDDQRLETLDGFLQDHAELKKQASGGSAANTLIAAANFGAQVFYSCKVANDALGQFYHSDLVASGVSTNLQEISAEGSTGRCLVMVTDDAERTMNTYLGITGDLGPHEVDQAALAQSRMVYIEGYLASAESARQAAIKAHQLARAAQIPVAFTFSDPAMVTYFRDAVAEIIGPGVDLLFCNEQEAMTWTETHSPEDAFDQLGQTAQTWVCTQGAAGATVFDGISRHQIPGRSVKAVDTNGAGDMFAGAFLYGRQQHWSFAEAARFAVYAASHLVTQFGPRLPLADHRWLLQEYARTHSA